MAIYLKMCIQPHVKCSMKKTQDAALYQGPQQSLLSSKSTAQFKNKQ